MLVSVIAAQAPAPPPAVPPAQAPATQIPEPAHRGQILIQSHGEPPPASDAPPLAAPAQGDAPRRPAENTPADLSDAERTALTVTSYDLDARLQLGRSGLGMRARITVRNTGAAPLKHLALQVSSTLHWESATLIAPDRRTPLPLSQHRLDTDADHTGAATEAVLSLPEPLVPGASAALDLFYSGTLAPSGERLSRLGADAAQQRSADWDGVGTSWTGLRGFGNVLWYPVASPQLFLAEGNTLFAGIGRMRHNGAGDSVRLRLSVEYEGEPPVAAYFCGRRAPLRAVSDAPDAPTAAGTGVATAEFPAEPLGFRVLSLFVLHGSEVLLGSAAAAPPAEPGPAGSSSSNPDAVPPAAAPSAVPSPPSAASVQTAPDGPLVALVSADPGTAAGLGAAAARVGMLLAEWMGPRPLSALTVLDHAGQPFQDGPLLVAPAATLQTSPEAPALAYSLTHAWLQTGQPWMDEGLAQFFALLSVEREAGRDAAVAQLNELLQPVALAEPEFAPGADAKTAGQPILSAPDEVFYRRKAAAVWWMLRDLAGEKPLRAALEAWRTQPASQSSPEAQAVAFQHLLERLSGKPFGWFFADWVLQDRGLPDLTLADVQTSRTPAGPGHSTGWLVAVTVRNEGGAVADVPVIVRSGAFSTTERLRIPGFSQATQRVLVESPPTEVTVNDGGTPELRVSRHTRQLNGTTQQR